MTESLQDRLQAAASLAADLPGLLLEAEKVAHTFMRGVHGRRRTGQGETFWQFRPYQQGDSSRDIDWRQSGKRDDTFTRQLEWEASQTVWMYRDASASMDYRSSGRLRTKREYAELLLLSLSMIILSGGEQVGLLGTDLRPQTHDRAIEKIFEYLPRQTAMAETGRPVSAGGQVILIGDFYMPPEQLAAFCGNLAQRRVSGLLVQLCDPAEETLPFRGRVIFEDAEAPGRTHTIGEVDAVRARYLERFQAHRAALSAAAAACGWHFAAVRTDEKPDAVLTRLHDVLSVRKQG